MYSRRNVSEHEADGRDSENIFNVRIFSFACAPAALWFEPGVMLTAENVQCGLRPRRSNGVEMTCIASVRLILVTKRSESEMADLGFLGGRPFPIHASLPVTEDFRRRRIYLSDLGFQLPQKLITVGALLRCH